LPAADDDTDADMDSLISGDNPCSGGSSRQFPEFIEVSIFLARGLFGIARRQSFPLVKPGQFRFFAGFACWGYYVGNSKDVYSSYQHPTAAITGTDDDGYDATDVCFCIIDCTKRAIPVLAGL
jgi:hypothetical protein